MNSWSREILEFLADLRDEALREAERLGSLCGPILPAQRPWSWAIDAIEAELQAAAEGGGA